MRYLIVSDIHANWEALQAVLQAAAGHYEQTICCGDLVGYGPDPNLVVDWVRGNVARLVRGNHDKAMPSDWRISEWFNPVAKAAAEWTANALTPENREYVTQLPKGPLDVENFQIAHGSPLDEDEYLFGAAEVSQAFAYLDRDVTFFGHTHAQGGFTLGRGCMRILSGPAREESSTVLDLDPDNLYLINPGAVGQPRDADPRAAYILYDSAQGLVEYHRREYDIAAVQDKIRRAGLPELLANRLVIGH